MQRYIQQLIEDLEKAAENPQTSPFIEPPPHLDNNPVAAELALVPFKPISEWTGIDANVFPEMIYLSADEAGRVNQAILKLLESFQIEVVDIPEDFPPELLYDVLINSWDEFVQYLPFSGFDLELCTGNPMTCPYGDYCDCGTWQDSPIEDELPDKNTGNIQEVELPF